MKKCVFLAGANGVLGRRLIPLLLNDGWRVVGTTRSVEKAEALRKAGVEPVVLNIFDANAVREAVSAAHPELVIHMLTDLPAGLDPAKMAEALPRNARIRDEGTLNLVAAAAQAGVKRMIAQSVAFAYAEGPLPHTETDPLNINAGGNEGLTARGVASLERQTLAGPWIGIVLRYGLLYGPGTGFDSAFGSCSVSVDAAALAAKMAATNGPGGIYNVAEDGPFVSSEKAKNLMGWFAKTLK